MTSSTDKNIRQIRLRWSGEGLVFRGGAPGGPEVIVDGSASEGAAPMQMLLLSLAGCMGIDIKMILEKSRVAFEDLEIEVTGERAPEPPRRYVRIDILCRVKGPAPEDADKVRRAVELSRDKYCSVLHSLDPATDIGVRIAGLDEVAAAVP